MAAVCNLTDLVSWFVCAEQHAYFGEFLTIVVFLIFFYQTRDFDTFNGVSASLLVATIVALGLFGVGALNAAFAVAMIFLLGLSVLAQRLS